MRHGPTDAQRAPDPSAEQEWRLDVEILDKDGVPIRGRVCVLDAGGDSLSESLTDPPAKLVQRVRGTVCVIAQAWSCAPQFFGELGPSPSGVRSLVVRAERGLVISGWVVDDAGKPVTRARARDMCLRAEPLDPPSWLRPRPNDWNGCQCHFESFVCGDGSFRFEGLLAGSYEIHCVQLRRGRGSAETLLDPKSVLAASGDADVRVVCQRAVEVHVRLLDADTGEVLPSDAAASWKASDEHELWQSGTGFAGAIVLDVPPGASFTLAVEVEGYHRPEPFLVAANREPGSQDVVVRLGRDPDAFAELELVVRDDIGAPAFPLWVGTARGVKKLSAADGRYVLRLAAGSQRITLSSSHEQTLRFRREWCGDQPEAIGPSGAYIQQDLAVDLPRGGRITRGVTLQRAAVIWVRWDPEDDFSDIRLFQGSAEKRALMGLGEGMGIVAAVEPGAYTVEGRVGEKVVTVDVATKAAEVAEVWLRAEGAK